MKNSLLAGALFALTLALASGTVNAQSLRFHGALYGGLVYHFTDNEDSDPVFYAGNTETEVPVKMEFALDVGIGESYGLSFGLAGIYEGSPPATDPFSRSAWLFTGYGWLMALEKQLTFSGGMVDWGDYETRGGLGAVGLEQALNSRDTDLNYGPGLMVEYKPFFLYGLSVSAAVYANQRSAGESISQAQYNINASYEASDIGRVIGGFRSHKIGSNNEKDSAAYISLEAYPLQRFGFNKFNFDCFIYNLGDEFIRDQDSRGKIESGQLISWNYIPNLEAGLRFTQRFYAGDQADGENYTPDLRFWLWLQYSLTNSQFIPRIDFLYVNGSNPRNGSYFIGSLDWSGHNKHLGGFAVNPNIKWMFWTENNYIELGYIFIKDLSEYAYSTPETSDHAFYLNYVVRY
jgi:hypothetical protein